MPGELKDPISTPQYEAEQRKRLKELRDAKRLLDKELNPDYMSSRFKKRLRQAVQKSSTTLGKHTS